MPIQCDLSDGTNAVVKYRNNREGSLTLVNEVIANSLAQKIGIEAPSFGVCTLSMNAQVNPIIDPQDFCLKEEHCGSAYYIEFVKRTRPFSPSACDRYSHDQLVKMVLFDHIIYNKDRAPRNILIPICKSDAIFPIDYSHVFKNECIWNRHTFHQGIASNDYLDRHIIESNKEVYKPVFLYSCPSISDFEQLVNDIPTQLTDSFIQSIIDELPTEWLDDATIDMQDTIALKEYLLYRISHLDELIELIIEEGRQENVTHH